MPTKTEIKEVSLLDLNAQYDKIKGEVKEAINEVLESQYFIMGPEVSSFEEQVAEYCNAEHALGCASGSDALLLALMALDIGPGDAVITTPYTFFATAGAISRLGATPIFLDINPRSYNIDPGHVEDFLAGNHPLHDTLDVSAEDVKAMIPVHLYGQMADMNPLMTLAREYDISVIEDAAQGIGAEYKGRRAGTIGDFGCFSFFPSKNLGGYGDGGLVTTRHDDMAEKLDILRLHGASPKYHHSMVGINSRLDAIQAAVLKVKLKYLDEWSEQRREKAMIYNELFEKAGLATDYNAGCPDGKVILPEEICGAPEKNGRHIYHQYVIRTSDRDKVMEALDENNIGHSIYYPVSLHEQECFSYLGYDASDCPEATKASNTTVALPVYPELSEEQQEYVVNTISKTLNS